MSTFDVMNSGFKKMPGLHFVEHQAESKRLLEMSHLTCWLPTGSKQKWQRRFRYQSTHIDEKAAMMQ